MSRASNVDWWQGKAGPEKGRPGTWQKIQPGYYRLRGTDIYIANMEGTSVGNTGLSRPWDIRTEPLGAPSVRIGSVYTIVEAKARALSYAREARLIRAQ